MGCTGAGAWLFHAAKKNLAAQTDTGKPDQAALHRPTCLIPEKLMFYVGASRVTNLPVEPPVQEGGAVCQDCRALWWGSSQLDEGPQHQVNLGLVKVGKIRERLLTLVASLASTSLRLLLLVPPHLQEKCR